MKLEEKNRKIRSGIFRKKTNILSINSEIRKNLIEQLKTHKAKLVKHIESL